ncbi:MAG: hypothetical protein NZ957_02425, partial [Thaumarchaeota archaeon]|nr:hypothetical protein [Candidatus Calditenuaceae archaeon]
MSETELQLLRNRLERLYYELMEIEQQLHPIVTRIRIALGEFLGIPEPQPVAEAMAERPRQESRMIIVPVEAPAPAITDRGATLRVPTVRLLSYREHWFTVAPNRITFTGADFDLGQDYDTVLLSPSIDAQIEINKPVEPTTPVIFANTIF